MITVGFSTRADKPHFIDSIKSTIGIKDVQIIQKINNNAKSLTEVYNEILNESENDIVILCHDDILFESKYWGKRILEHFEKKPQYGILGVAGSKYFPSSGRWWEIQSEMMGQVYHQKDGRRWLSEYSKNFGGKIKETALVDGVFMAINKKSIKKNFVEDFKGFHFYDVSFCIENYIEGVKIGVVSNISIVHLSIGETNKQWEVNRIFFTEKYKNYLPIKIEENYSDIKMDEKFPLVSIIIPIYNYGLMFERTLNSVIDSTYKNYEIIIVNDGSNDEYVLMKLKSLDKVPFIKILHKENGGPSSARNYGIKNSNGSLILPLDADDMVHPDYIQTCVNILRNNSQISPVYCDTQHVGLFSALDKRPEWNLEELKNGNYIVNCSMFHRKAFDESGGYDETLYGWEDYDLWLRMGLRGYVGKRIPKPLFMYFHHENDNTVSTHANKNHQELHKKILEKNFLSHEN